MISTKSPHILFRKMLGILDELRRDSIHAIKEAEKDQIHGLSVRQGSAISQLKLMLEEEPEGVSLKDLAKRMQMTVPASSLLVEALVTKGYVERQPNPNDRRAVQITLTDKGNGIFQSVYASFHDEIDRRAQALTPEELDAFASIIEKMRA